MGRERRAGFLVLALASVIGACSVFADFSGLAGNGNADASPASDATKQDVAVAAEAGPCSPGSCAFGSVCCVVSTTNESLPEIFSSTSARCMNLDDCTGPFMSLSCNSPYFCADSGVGDHPVCCVSHDQPTKRFISAACVPFTQCKTSGPQDILCDLPDASVCNDDDVDSGADAAPHTCKQLGIAGDGTNFDIAICH